MAIKIANTDAINNAKKGIFLSFNPGQYTDSSRPSSPVAGDLIYNTDEKKPQYWDGGQWITMGCC